MKKNKKYVIIGESGSGKSTLVNMLIGYIDDYSGEILLNGKDIREISRKSLFNEIEYVNSENFIFYSTILNNISLFNNVESKEEIIKIIDDLKLSEIDTGKELGDDIISTGQKQRINLARALINKKKILILDEATANLDLENRRMIESMFLGDENLTLIMITHHLDESLKDKFDSIIDLNKIKNNI